MEFVTHSPEETLALGKQLGASYPPNTVLLLTGDLGAGKTTLSKGLVSGATGISEDEVTSPTFVYLNIYQGEKPVYHFDLYRLTDADEFLGMGFDEFFYAGGLTLIEWPERIEAILPESIVRIEISGEGESSRRFTVNSL